MSKVNIAAALLRVQADQAGSRELFEVAECLVKDAELRERVSLLGQMSAELPIEKRQENARDFLNLLFSWTTPSVAAESLSPMRAAWFPTDVFRKNCMPAPTTGWYKHIGFRRLQKTREAATFTNYLGEVVGSVEGLWGVKGHLSTKR